MSLFADWFFCTSNNYTIDKTIEILAIADAIENNAMGKEVVEQGLRQLANLDISAATYLLPRALKAISTIAINASNKQKLLTRYFSAFVIDSDKHNDGGSDFEQLLEMLFEQDNWRQKIKYCQQLAVQLNDNKQVAEPPQSPYIDIVTFKAPAFILSVLLVAATNEIDDVREILHLDNGDVALTKLYQNALNGYLGRQCWLLSLNLKHLLIDKSTEQQRFSEALDIFSQELQEHVGVLFTPDVFNAVLAIAFGKCSTSNASLFKREMSTLALFRQAFSQMRAVPHARVSGLKLLDINVPPHSSGNGLLVLWWVNSLWRQLIASHPNEALDLLTPIWQPWQGKKLATCELFLPTSDTNDDCKALQQLIKPLIRDGASYVVTKNDGAIPTDDNLCHIYSPWIAFVEKSNVPNRYIDHRDKTHNVCHLFRVIGGFECAKALLLAQSDRLEQSITNRKLDANLANFLAQLAQADDVLSIFQPRSTSYSNKLPMFQFAESFDALFFAARARSLNFCAGLYPAITPQSWFELAMLWQNKGASRQAFLTYVLPERVIDWMQHGYRTAQSKFALSGRWLQSKDFLLLFNRSLMDDEGSLKEELPHNQRFINLFMNLRAAFYSEESFDKTYALKGSAYADLEQLAQEYDVTNSHDSSNSNVKASKFQNIHRKVLYALNTSAKDWIDEYSIPSKLLNLAKLNNQITLHLILLTERLCSVFNPHQRQQDLPSLTEIVRWQKALIVALDSIDHRIYLDRFLCIKLLDVLDKDTDFLIKSEDYLATEDDNGELLITASKFYHTVIVVLMQFGELYELKRLNQILLKLFENKRLPKTRRFDQTVVYLSNYITSQHSLVVDGEQNIVIDWLNYHKRRAYATELLHGCIMLSRYSEHEQIIKAYKNLRVHNLTFNWQQRFETVKGYFITQQYGYGERISKVEVMTPLADWQIRVGAINLNTASSCYSVYTDTHHEVSLTDSFTLNEQELKQTRYQLNNSQQFYVNGIVCEHGKVNIGLYQLLVDGLNVDTKQYPTGSVIKLGMKRLNNERTLVLDEQKKLFKHGFNSIKDGLMQMNVCESIILEQGKLAFNRSYYVNNNIANISEKGSRKNLQYFPQEWTFDYSNLYSQSLTIAKQNAEKLLDDYVVIAKARINTEQTGIIPTKVNYGRFADLLIAIEQSDYVILAFEGPAKTDENGDLFYRVSIKPGLCFKLPQSCFEPYLWEVIEDRLNLLASSGLDELDGLLVSVCPTWLEDEGVVQLAAYESELSADNKVFVQYKDFNFPIDDRNIRWRYAFSRYDWPNESDNPTKGDDLQYIRAFKEGSKWFTKIQHPINGYPEIVQVEVKQETLRREDEKDVTFAFAYWDHGLKIISYVKFDGNFEQQVKIIASEIPENTLGSGYTSDNEDNQEEALCALFDYLANVEGLDETLAVKIKRLDSFWQPKYGYMKAYSTLGLTLMLEVDSLVLDPITDEYQFKHNDISAHTTAKEYSSNKLLLEVQPSDIEQLKKWAVAHSLTGILVSRPKPIHSDALSDAAASFGVYWQNDSNDTRWTQYDIRISNVNQLNSLRIGGLITIHWQGENAKVYAQNINVSARAIWPKGFSVNEIDNQPKLLETYELFVPYQNLGEFQQTKRAAITAHGQTWWGLVNRYQRSGTVKLLATHFDETEISVDNSQGKFISRRFKLKALDSARVNTDYDPKLNRRGGIDWCDWIKQYNFIVPDVIKGKVILRESGITFRVDNRHNFYNVPELLVSEDEGAYLAHNNYAKFGRAVLISEALARESYLLSFRKVPPITRVAKFKKRLQAYLTGTKNDLIDFEISPFDLYFVGPVRQDDDSIDPNTVVFELGYGDLLELDTSVLCYKGEAFNTADLNLFRGDRITKVRFIDNKLSIEETRVSSDDVKLYWQAKEHKIVHLLTITTAPEPQVVCVDGFNSKSVNQGMMQYKPQHVSFDDASLQRIQERTEGLRRKGEDYFTIAARLDTECFEQSHGSELRYQHIVMSFSPPNNLPGLERDSRVFVMVNQIHRITNDMGLTIDKVQGLMDEDFGEDLKKLLILRRQFSVREDRLSAVEATDELAKKVILIKIQQNPHTSRVYGLLYEPSMPKRDYRILFGLLDTYKEYYAAYIEFIWNQNPQDNIHNIELAPGVRIELSSQQIYFAEDLLQQGDIIRITRSGDKFVLQRASIGDRNYIVSEERPAVVLPKGILLNKHVFKKTFEDNRFWHKQKPFIPAGMPNIELQPVSNNRNAALQMKSLMSKPHPKLAFINQDKDRLQVRLPEHDNDIIAFSLYADRASKTININGMNNSLRQLVRWSDFCFATEEADNIIWRILNCRWYFHDSRTGYWTEEFEVNQSNVQPASATKGPLFLQQQGDNYTAKYGQGTLRRYGYPIRFLLDILKSLYDKNKQEQEDKNHRKSSNTVSLTVFVAGITENSVWVEAVPGLVVELPWLICFVKEQGQEFTLDHFATGAVQIGDRLILGYKPASATAVERICLIQWQSSALGLCTPWQWGVLPKIRRMPKGTGDQFGAGQFTLTLPCAKDEHFADLIQFSQTKGYARLDESRLKNSIALVGFDPIAKRPFIHGMREYTVFVDGRALDEAVVQNDWLSGRLFYQSPKGAIFDGYASQWVHACGDAIPVLITNVLPDKKTLFINRFHQAKQTLIANDNFATATLTGIHEPTKQLVFRCGPDFLLLSIRDVIKGVGILSPEDQLLVAKMLPRNQGGFWLYRDTQGKLSAGISKNTSNQFNVKVIKAVASEQGHGLGVLCQALDNLGYYWLPSTQLAWAELNFVQLTKWALGVGIIKVQLFNPDFDDSYISITQLADNKRLFDLASVGEPLSCQIIAVKSKVEQLLLAKEQQTGLCLSVEIFDAEEFNQLSKTLAKDDKALSARKRARALNMAVIVTSQISGIGGGQSIITATSAKHRYYRLNLPNCFFVKKNPKDLLSRLSNGDYVSLSVIEQQEQDEQNDNLPANFYAPQWQQINLSYEHLVHDQFNLDQGVAAAFDLVSHLQHQNWLPLSVALKAICIVHFAAKNTSLLRDYEQKDKENLNYLAVDLFKLTKLRALNSLHVEVLTRALNKGLTSFTGQSKQLNEILDGFSKFDTAAVDKLSYERIENLIEKAKIYGKEIESYAQVNALAMSIGNPLDFNMFFNAHKLRECNLDKLILQDVVNLGRCFPVMSLPQKLTMDDFFIRQFKNLIIRLVDESIDIPLLKPLPLKWSVGLLHER